MYIHKDKSSCLITVFEILVQSFVKDSSANTLLSFICYMYISLYHHQTIISLYVYVILPPDSVFC